MSEPVTREELDQALTSLKQELKQELQQEMNQLLERVTELARDVQTEILKAFFPFQESVGLRFRKL